MSLAITEEKIEATRSRGIIFVMDCEPTVAEGIYTELTRQGYDLKIDDKKDRDQARSRSSSFISEKRFITKDDTIQVTVLFTNVLAQIENCVVTTEDKDKIQRSFAASDVTTQIETLLRRLIRSRASSLYVGPLHLDLIERRAWRGSRELSLVPREFELLAYFMRRPNQVITRRELVENLWNDDRRPQANSVDVYVSRLRREIDALDKFHLIQTIRRQGFKLLDKT